MNLGRVLTAMVTPFDESGQVDYKQAKALACALLDSGSDGLVIAGTTGESPTLLREEELRLFGEIKSVISGRGALVANTGSNSTAEALVTTKEAERQGVDACLLVVPYYNKPTQEGLYQHFKVIAQSTSLPCILYNVPSRTAVGLSVDTVVRLSRIDNIVGIKEAGGNLDHVGRIVSEARDGFLVYSGNDNDTLPIMSIGGYGVVSVASHLVGKQMREIVMCAINGELGKAADIHRRLLPLFEALFSVTNPIPIKYALNYVGFQVGNPRLPLTPPDADVAAAIETSLAKCKLDLSVG